MFLMIRTLVLLCAALAFGALSVTAVSATRAKTDLQITVWPNGEEGPSRRFTLRCQPVGGTLPERARACRMLLARAMPFEPVPEVAVCTTQYGGPQVATVRGRFRGELVNTRFERRNGCEISRWDRVRLLFPLR